MRARRQLMTAGMALLLFPLAAAPAQAAPPGNDEAPGAVVLQLGDRVVQDTSEATTTPEDAALNANCGAPATNASVWYSYTSDRDRTLVLDVTTSDYSVGVLIFAGTPTADSLETCGPGVVTLGARAGVTYTMMVFADTSVRGGRLVLSVDTPPPPPRVHVTVARSGVVLRDGAARLHGTFSCKGGVFAGVNTRLFQRAGRLKVRGQSVGEVRCNGTRHEWSARVVSPVGTYAPGHALATVTIIGCGIFDCSRDKTSRPVHLSRAVVSHRQPSMFLSTVGLPRPGPLAQLQRRWPAS